MPVDKFGRTTIYSTTSRVVSNGLTASQADSMFIRRNGQNNATSDIDMNTNKLINVAEPTNPNDAATKYYVDTIIPNPRSLEIVPNSSLTCMGVKSQTLEANTGTDEPNTGTDEPNTSTNGTAVFIQNSGPGILRKLWLEFKGTNPNGSVSSNVFIRIYADNTLCIGSIACDLLFAPLGGPFYTNSLQGCNMHSNIELGGYFTLDLPFKTNLKIELNNKTGNPLTYSLQPFITISSTQQANISLIPPFISDLKLYSSTLRYLNTTYGNEYILLNTASNRNGVYLKYIRMDVIGKSGNWYESRVRMYDGIDSPKNNDSVIQPWTPYNYSNLIFPGYENNSRCIYCSSGLVDFYLSSWNGINTSFANRSSGLLYQSKPKIDSTTTISFYRNFGKNDSMPSVTNGRRLVVTINSGDEQVGKSGSFSEVKGVIYYYA